MPSTKGNKRKRVVLTIEQKLEICDKIKQKVSYAEVMGLCNIGKSTICDIKKSENKMREFTSIREQFLCFIAIQNPRLRIFLTHSLIRYFRLSERFLHLFGRSYSDKREFTVLNKMHFSHL